MSNSDLQGQVGDPDHPKEKASFQVKGKGGQDSGEDKQALHLSQSHPHSSLHTNSITYYYIKLRQTGSKDVQTFHFVHQAPILFAGHVMPSDQHG